MGAREPSILLHNELLCSALLYSEGVNVCLYVCGMMRTFVITLYGRGCGAVVHGMHRKVDLWHGSFVLQHAQGSVRLCFSGLSVLGVATASLLRW